MTRELLELAARAMGPDRVVWHTELGLWLSKDTRLDWNPATSQADSADLRDALEIDVQYNKLSVYATTGHDDGCNSTVNYNGTPEDRSRAVREAVLAVAAEIGRAK